MENIKGPSSRESEETVGVVAARPERFGEVGLGEDVMAEVCITAQYRDDKSRELKVVIVEDSDDDARLIARSVEKSGYRLKWKRVEDAEALRQALEDGCDLVLSDYWLPSFSAPAALEIVREIAPDLPFIVISGTIGESVAVETMKAGAHDYLMKDNLTRLPSAIERELRELRVREEKRRVTRALQVSEETYRTLVETSPDAILLTDLGGRILKANRQAVRMNDCSNADDLIGRSVYDLQEDQPRGLAQLKRIYETGEGRQQEMVLKTTAGRCYCAEVSAASVPDPTGDRAWMILIIRDVTTRKNLQIRLTETDRMASIGLLSAGVAHEINNPLMYVLNAVENLREGFPKIETAVSAVRRLCDEAIVPVATNTDLDIDHLKWMFEQVENADVALERIVQIVRDVKLFSRVKDASEKPIDLNQVIESAANIARNEIKYRARLEKTLRPLPFVKANEGRLCQVFLNLLTNAAQALGEGAPERHLITIETWAEDERVWASVSDTGCGIEPERLPHIFDVFHTSKPSGVGTGLGLAISKSILCEYGGEIQVESRLGLGTTFRLFLPAISSADEQANAPSMPYSDAGNSGRILVVDDDALIAETLRRMLLPEHDVVVTHSFREAMGALSKGVWFDVILCNLVMPETSGVEFFRWLEQAHPALTDRVLFMTAGTYSTPLNHFLESRKNHQLEKPFGRDQLTKRVGEVMRRRR